MSPRFSRSARLARPDGALPRRLMLLWRWLCNSGDYLLDDCCLCRASLPSKPSSVRRAPICSACLSWFEPVVQHDIAGDAVCLGCGTRCQGPAAIAPGLWPCRVTQCAVCVDRCSPFSRVVAPYRYQWPVDRLIGQFKYHEQRHLGPLFGLLLARAVDEIGLASSTPPLVLPMPLHPTRHASRGFNQAADMARWCARALALEARPHWVSRVEDTGSLAAAGRADRELAIRGAFAVSTAVEGCHLALVDDVLTTGATAAELARECLDSGAASVELWVIARTVARPQRAGSNSRRRTFGGNVESADSREPSHTAA